MIVQAVVVGLLSVATYQDLKKKAFMPILATGILVLGAAYHAYLSVLGSIQFALPAYLIALSASSLVAYLMYRLELFAWADAYIISCTVAAFAYQAAYVANGIYLGLVGQAFYHVHITGEEQPAGLPGVWIGTVTGLAPYLLP
jgi:ABC-type multidrug transport system permease subunit